MLDEPSKSEWENFVFRRPKDIYGARNLKFTLFDDIRPDDVQQGRCGDCYYLSSLSTLAENPKRIKDLFITKEVNEAGCYAVNMVLNGE